MDLKTKVKQVRAKKTLAQCTDIVGRILNSKDFTEIGNLRDELNSILDSVEEKKVRAWLKKTAKQPGYTPISNW